MARTGRPSNLDPATQQRIVAAVRAGASRRQAADAGGVSRATLSRWLSLGLEPGAPERYAEFNRAVRAAQDGATRQRFEDDRRDAERYRALVRQQKAQPRLPGSF
jgi:transposase